MSSGNDSVDSISILFYAKWCNPCKSQNYVQQSIFHEIKKRVTHQEAKAKLPSRVFTLFSLQILTLLGVSPSGRGRLMASLLPDPDGVAPGI